MKELIMTDEVINKHINKMWVYGKIREIEKSLKYIKNLIDKL